LPFRSHSDVGSRRLCRFRRVTNENDRVTDIALQLRSPEADQISTGTGNRSFTHPSRSLGRRSFHWSLTGNKRATDVSTRLESIEDEEFSIGTGNRSSRSSMTSPRLRRAAFNVAAMSRARVRTLQMTLCIVLSFIACWTPYFTVHLIHIWTEYQRQIPESVYVFAETLALVNSAVNPLLYACFNSSMSCWRCRRRPADRPLERVNGRSQTSAFVSAAAGDSSRTWPRAAADPPTWFGHTVDSRRSTNIGAFLGAKGSNGRGTSTTPV